MAARTGLARFGSLALSFLSIFGCDLAVLRVNGIGLGASDICFTSCT